MTEFQAETGNPYFQKNILMSAFLRVSTPVVSPGAQKDPFISEHYQSNKE